MKELFKHSSGSQPPSIIFFEGQAQFLEALIKDHGHDFKFKVSYLADVKTVLKPDEIYFADICLIP